MRAADLGQRLAGVHGDRRGQRNTLRYLIANLYDFDPAADLVDRARLEEVDRYILARYADAAERILRAYQVHEYGTIFQALNTFATLDLSAFYADVSKDRLYTFAARSRERRAAQTAMYIDGRRPDAPDGADPLVHRGRAVAVPSGPPRGVGAYGAFPGSRGPGGVRRCRPAAALDSGSPTSANGCSVEIEPLRKDKQIGSSLQAKAVVSATDGGARVPRGATLGDLPMLFIVSEVELRPR